MDLSIREKEKLEEEVQPWGHSLSTDTGGQWEGAEHSRGSVKWAALLTDGSTLNYTEVTPDVSWKLTYGIKYNSVKLKFSKIHSLEYLLKRSFQYFVSKWMSYFLKKTSISQTSVAPKTFFVNLRLKSPLENYLKYFENSIAPNSIHLYSCLWTQIRTRGMSTSSVVNIFFTLDEPMSFNSLQSI